LIEMSDSANTNDGLVFAVDLGGTHLRASTVSKDGKIHRRHKQETPRTNNAKEIVQAIVQAAGEFQKCNAIAHQSVQSVSVAVPGTVNVAEGVIVKAPNLPSLDGFSLSAELSSQLKLPALLENDANAAAVGEMWQGAARGRRTIVCLTLGTGVGGGIILDGKVWRGVNGAAAEIGHMCVDPFGGIACPCGSQGCLEVYASATAIVRMAREYGPQHVDSCLNDVRELTAKKIYDAGVNGDPLALEVFKRMGVYLGIGIANLINILDPEMIVIGGGVANAWPLFETQMRQQVVERGFSTLAARINIARAECGDDAGLLGAARLAFDRRS
jgi:glucokinase